MVLNEWYLSSVNSYRIIPITITFSLPLLSITIVPIVQTYDYFW